MHSSSAREDRLDRLLAEYMRRVDQGVADRQRFLAAHPDCAAELAQLLDTEQALLRLAGPPVDQVGEGAGDEGAGDATAPFRHDTDDAETLALPTAQRGEAGVNSAARAEPAGAEQTPRSDPPAGASSRGDAGGPVVFGNYELLEILGRGGMGVVYRARQKGLERDVALKMILNARLASEEDIQRFQTEARAAANIRHEHVVDIYEIGQVQSQHFFSMELIEGADLSRIMREGRIEGRRAAALLRDAAAAVHAAHQCGLLHRDIKPGNILIDENERVVVTDFGLAQELTAEDQRLTATGLAMGTPSHMSPEQAAGRRELMGPATDIYSLGVVLYAMLTGEPPHRKKNVYDTLAAVLHEPAPSPAELNPNAAPALCRICLKCLAKDPAERYHSAAELANDLQRFLNGEPVVAQELSFGQRTLRWLQRIPLVAALQGRVVHQPTRGQLRAQAGLMLLALLAAVALVSYPLVRSLVRERMPANVTIAGGISRGVYAAFVQELAGELSRNTDTVWTIRQTTGSGENRELLLRGETDLAILQESKLRGEQVAVVAPLFEELVLVVARRDMVRDWSELAGAAMAVGGAGSGMASTAEMVLRDTGAELHYATVAKPSLDDGTFDGAVLTIGRGSSLVAELLADPRYKVLQLPPGVIERLKSDPQFVSASLPMGEAESMPTVATPAFLVCRRDAPAVLVKTTLERLYPPMNEHQLSREEAAKWYFMPLHPAAEKFFAAPPPPPPTPRPPSSAAGAAVRPQAPDHPPWLRDGPATSPPLGRFPWQEPAG